MSRQYCFMAVKFNIIFKCKCRKSNWWHFHPLNKNQIFLSSNSELYNIKKGLYMFSLQIKANIPFSIKYNNIPCWSKNKIKGLEFSCSSNRHIPRDYIQHQILDFCYIHIEVSNKFSFLFVYNHVASIKDCGHVNILWWGIDLYGHFSDYLCVLLWMIIGIVKKPYTVCLLGILRVQSNWTLVINNKIALHSTRVLLWESCGCFILFIFFLSFSCRISFRFPPNLWRVTWNSYEKLKF